MPNGTGPGGHRPLTVRTTNRRLPCTHARTQVVLYFNDVKEGGETVFTHAPGIDHHDVPDTKVPVAEVRHESIALGQRAHHRQS